jgi:hypothetical protein
MTQLVSRVLSTCVCVRRCRRRIFGCCAVLLHAGKGPHKRRQVMAPGEIRASKKQKRARIPQSYNIVSRKRSCEMRADKLLYYFYGVVRSAQMAATPPPAPESAARRKWRYRDDIAAAFIISNARPNEPSRPTFLSILSPILVCAYHTPRETSKIFV